MAYKSVLTPFLGEDVEETLASFMNMKFGELLGNTEDNRQQISILSGITNIKQYSNPTQFGLVDTELTGMTLAQTLGKIAEKMGNNSRFMMRMTSVVPNMRATIGMGKASTLLIEVVDAGIYTASLNFDDSNAWYRTFGNITTNTTGWNLVATTATVGISCTANTGYSIFTQQNFRINNIVYYNLRVTKTDSTNFTAGTQIAPINMPSGNMPATAQQYGTGSTLNDGVATGDFCSVTFHPNALIYVNPSTSKKYINISGVVIL